MLGIAVGMVLSLLFGLVPADALARFGAAPLVAVPVPHYLAYDFRPALIPAFLMAGSAAMLRTVGVITICQKINDSDWKRPDLDAIRGGILADGLGCVLGGLLGVIGMNTAPSLVGVSKATGATSRAIAWACAAILLAFAFIPKYAALFLMLPPAVIGASMVFTSSFMIAGGIQIILSRSIDSRTTYIVGVSLLLGLAREIFPQYFKAATPAVHLFTGSMMSIGVASAFLLNLVFRLGARRRAQLTLEDADVPLAEFKRTLDARTRAWSLPVGLGDRAVATTEQVVQHLAEAGLATGPVAVLMSWNDFDLAIAIRYKGALLSLPNVGVRRNIFLEEEAFSFGLADFLTGVYPDRMEARAEGEDAEIRLSFSG
jgi:NCS2 family nucleobase:cation symporter-2